MNNQPKLDATGWMLLFVLGIIWGGSFLFARIAVQEIPPLTLVFLRVAIAAVVLYIFLIVRRITFKPNMKLWAQFATMGVLNNIIPFGLIFYGQQEIGAGLAAIVNAMTPIWSLIIAHQFTSDEKMSVTKIIGVGLGFIGVAILIGWDAFGGFSAAITAQVAILGATISYGFASVYGKRFANVSPQKTALGQLTASSVIILPIALIIEKSWAITMPTNQTIISTILLAVLCTAIAYILYFEILARAGAVNASLVTLIVPVFGVLLGALILSEILNANQWIGMVVILAGLAVMNKNSFIKNKNKGNEGGKNRKN